MFVITSRTCVVCPPKKCVANLHDNSKSNMAAIVNKVYLDLCSDSRGTRLLWNVFKPFNELTGRV